MCCTKQREEKKETNTVWFTTKTTTKKNSLASVPYFSFVFFVKFIFITKKEKTSVEHKATPNMVETIKLKKGGK